MSYATVEFADNYFNSQYDSPWKTIEMEIKQQLLDNATMNIDSLEYRGKKLNPAHENEFPRQFKDRTFSDDIRISKACCEEALSIYENKGVNLNLCDDFSDFKLGDISISGSTKQSINKSLLYSEKAEILLKPYIKSNSFKVIL